LEGSKGGREGEGGMKQGNKEQTAVPNVSVEERSFQLNANYFHAKNQVLVNTAYQFASLAKQIHAFSKEGYNTTQGTDANL
jgi:hypothetical protein